MTKTSTKYLIGTILVIFLLFICVPIISVTLIPASEDFDGYNYSDHRQVQDHHEVVMGPGPGDPFPEDAVAYDMDGNQINLKSLWSEKPLVLEFGSLTCPIFHGTGPTMDELYNKYDKGHAEQAHVGLLYVREAHPGWFTPIPDSHATKLEYARTLKAKGIDRNIWVDSLHGNLHSKLGGFSNAIYVIDTNGKVAYKSIWNIPSVIDRILDQLINGKVNPAKEMSNLCLSPAKYYTSTELMAYIARIIPTGGPNALFDFLLNPVERSDNTADHCQVTF